MTFYQTSQWRHLARATKRRDSFQCQTCADRHGDPYCVLHAHHIIPRAQFGSDDLDNLITLCDLCHAVVTPRWHKPWFPDGTNGGVLALAEIRAEFEEFLRLPTVQRHERQRLIWESLGIVPADCARANV
jgi:hypothetical protein